MLAYYTINKFMTTYYLYIKTHKKTGLQYLGQTTQDPFVYQGSGDWWGKHIKKHGYDVDTNIIQKCYTKSALKSWGLYYSNLWSVVESKKWANLKPEEGDGFASGEYNPMKNSVIAQKHSVSINLSNIKHKQKQGMISSWQDTTSRTNRITAMRASNTDRSGNNNSFSDKTIYGFQHKSGIIENMTQYDFRKKYNLCQQSVSRFVKGGTKEHRGWQLI